MLDAGLVAGRPWASVSEPKVNLHGPRRYTRWREIIGRCLTDAADDGACIVLFTNCVEISCIFSPLARLARGFLGRVRGELLVADLHQQFDSNTGHNSRNFLVRVFLTRFSQSKNPLRRLRLRTLNLAYLRLPRSLRRISVEKPSVLLMVERCVFLVSILRPSNRVTYVWIAASSVEAREPGDVWVPVGSPLKHCRPRPLNPVQSSPCLLCLVSCSCMPCCFPFVCFCVLHMFCPCFRCFLSIFVSLGSRPRLVAGPRGCFSLSFSLSLSLFGRVRLCLCHVCGHVAGLLGFSLALILACCLYLLPCCASESLIAQCCSRPSWSVLVGVPVWCWLGWDCCWCS